LEVTMSVLVATTDGCHIFTSKGQQLTELRGHRVDALAPGPAGTWLGVVDRHAIWQHGADGEWTPLAKADVELTALATAGASVFAGTADARVLQLTDAGQFDGLPSFDAVPGRNEWHAVGMPLCVRSMTATCDGGALLVNVHVGGIPRSVDDGGTWSPTIAVDDDVHQVLAHPTRPQIVFAAASVGLCRSTDAGATWTSATDGMALTYARGVAIHDDTVLVTVSDGPRASRAAVYQAPVDGGPLTRVEGGLPEWLHGNVDTRCIASDGRRAALVDGAGDVWSAAEGVDGWERIASGLPGVTGLAVA
jgi:hypothetical protein